MKSRKPFLLRISPELFNELQAWAQQEFRSVNGQIEYLLKQAVSKRGRSSGGKRVRSRPAEEESVSSSTTGAADS